MVRTPLLLPSALVAAFVCSASADTVDGEVWLTDSPFCEFFAVKTERGLSLLDWRGGLYVFAEGDTARGPLHTIGLHAFLFNGSDEMRAEVEEVGVSLARAQHAYYSRCHGIKPAPPATLSAAGLLR